VENWVQIQACKGALREPMEAKGGVTSVALKLMYLAKRRNGRRLERGSMNEL
jgi:hypothetical protein